MKCKDCKHWKIPESNALDCAAQDITDENAPDCWSHPREALDYMAKKHGNRVGECRSPFLNRISDSADHKRPGFNEATVIDGERYFTALLTGEHFGCVNFAAPYKAADDAMVKQFEANARVDAESRGDKPLSDES